MTIRLLIIGPIIIFSCSTRTEVGELQGTSEKRVIGDTLNIPYGKCILHYFSNNSEKDTFKISLLGKSIVDGEIKFEIINKNGQLILNETFPAFDPLDLQTNATDEQKAEYVKGRVETFFGQEAFRKPAIGPNDLFMDDNSRKEIWDEIKADTSLVGFSYHAGYEDGRKIAYSRKLKSAVIYFECC